MDDQVEARLRRAGLTDEQIQAERDRYHELDADGQRLYVAWVEQVSDEDIAAAVDGDDRTPPVLTHAAQPQHGYVPVGPADDATVAVPGEPGPELDPPADDPPDSEEPHARKTGSRKEKHDE